ncbi:MAG: hypothetical protein AAGI24_04130 [Pseudomonadota bacterium]
MDLLEATQALASKNAVKQAPVYRLLKQRRDFLTEKLRNHAISEDEAGAIDRERILINRLMVTAASL